MPDKKGKTIKSAKEKSVVELRNEMILQITMDGFCVIGLDGSFLEVNPALSDIIGYSKEELLTMKIQDIEVIETPEQTLLHIEKITEQGYGRFETKQRRKNGEIIDIEVSSQFCDFGEDKLFFSFFRDITERKKVEQSLQESRERLRVALSAAQMGTWRWEPSTNQDTRDASFNEILGLEAVESTQPVDDFLQFIHPEDRDMVDGEIQRSLREHRTYVAEFRIIRPDGTVRWLRDQGEPFYDENDHVLYLTGAVVDITAHKEAEDKIRKFRTIADKANYGAAITDLDGNFLYINEYFAVVHGYTPEQLIGKNLTIFLDEEHRKEVPQTTQKLKEAGYINAIEIGHTHKDGTVFPMLMNLLIVKDENNQPLYMAATAIDITEKKQLEEKLGEYKERVFQSQKHAYVNAISAIVAHQVNQPLTTVNMLLDRAVDNAEEGSCSPDVVKDMKESLAEIKKAVSIIRKLRQYSKDLSLAGTGRVNVNAVADRIVTMLSERAAQAQMHILKDLDKLPEVKTNEAALEQVFLNIIQNAIDAADGKSRHELKITGKVRDGKIELQFVDDCCGITPEDLDRIFKPFFSTKPSSKGLGLGLDIVQQILINCGGEIRAESRVGKGTTFYVTLPVGEARGL